MSRPLCCSKCSNQSVCAVDRSCCLECHFAYEERVVLPHLPPVEAKRLVDEHRWLVTNGFPPDKVAIHAAWEDATFPMYCPVDVCDLIHRDHQAHQHGLLQSRAG